MTDFETTRLLEKSCPDCGEQTLILGVELIGGKAINIQYQIYCSDRDDCEFAHTPEWIDNVYTDNFSSFEEARSEAIQQAYKDALEQYEKEL